MMSKIDVDTLLTMPLRALIEATLLEPEGPIFYLMVGIAAGRAPAKYWSMREMIMAAGRVWDHERVRSLLRELDCVMEALDEA